MASTFDDELMDLGLDRADTNGTKIDILDSLATQFSDIAGKTLGNKTGLNTGATEAGDVDGRKVVVPAITDGAITSSGDATHWALSDGSSIFIASQTLSGAPIAVTSGNTFTLGAINITHRDST